MSVLIASEPLEYRLVAIPQYFIDKIMLEAADLFIIYEVS